MYFLLTAQVNFWPQLFFLPTAVFSAHVYFLVTTALFLATAVFSTIVTHIFIFKSATAVFFSGHVFILIFATAVFSAHTMLIQQQLEYFTPIFIVCHSCIFCPQLFCHIFFFFLATSFFFATAYFQPTDLFLATAAFSALCFILATALFLATSVFSAHIFNFGHNFHSAHVLTSNGQPLCGPDTCPGTCYDVMLAMYDVTVCKMIDSCCGLDLHSQHGQSTVLVPPQNMFWLIILSSCCIMISLLHL